MGTEFEALRQNVVKPALAEWQLALHERIYAVLRPRSRTSPRGAPAAGRSRTRTCSSRRAICCATAPRSGARLPTRFTHLLVDEFQDTDPLQAEILLYLTSDDPARRTCRFSCPGRALSSSSATRSSPSTGSAAPTSPRTWTSAARSMASGGHVVRLDGELPGRPRLTDPANARFRGLFPAAADDRQASFAPLEPVREDRSERSGAFRLLTAAGEKAKAAKSRGRTRRTSRVSSERPWITSGPCVRRPRAPRALRRLPRPDADARAPRRLRAGPRGAPASPWTSRGAGRSRSRRGSWSSGRFSRRSRTRTTTSRSSRSFRARSAASTTTPSTGSAVPAGAFRYLVDPPAGRGPADRARPRAAREGPEGHAAHPAGAALGLIVERLGLVARLAAGPEGRTRQRQSPQGPRARAPALGRRTRRFATSSSGSPRTRPRSISRR